MRNCIILGSGRSGSSMVAGTLAGSGYFMGDQLYAPRPANPRGFFEDVEVNAVNEAILAPVIPWLPPRFRPTRLYRLMQRVFFRGRPGDGQRWLARVPLEASMMSPPGIDLRIQTLVERAPYCFKDPRFCYTLSIWRQWLYETRFVCVFRDPTVSATSMMRELKTLPKLAGLKLTYDECLEVWCLMYSHVLDIHSQHGDWLFLHYDQVLSGAGVDMLAEFLDVVPDRQFPDPALRRTKPGQRMPEAVNQVYKRLCHRADKAV